MLGARGHVIKHTMMPTRFYSIKVSLYTKPKFGAAGFESALLFGRASAMKVVCVHGSVP